MTADITKEEYNHMRSVVYQAAGIYLGDEKKSLIVSRLNKHLNEYHLKDYGELLRLLGKDKKLFSKVINSISTNVTYFFRENDHFDFIADTIVPEAATHETIKVWSAGCSTGEEPYSVAICISEALRKLKLNAGVKVLATDISTDVIKKAQIGLYKPAAIKNVSKNLINRYFDKENNGLLRVKNFLKQMVSFRFFNLKDDINLHKKFDLVLCRNVMIYFDKKMRNHVLGIFYKALKPEGHLLIGHSESIHNSGINFEFIKSATYKKR